MSGACAVSAAATISAMRPSRVATGPTSTSPPVGVKAHACIYNDAREGERRERQGRAAGRLLRLSRRRAGGGRRPRRVHRAHEGAPRHDAGRRQRSRRARASSRRSRCPPGTHSHKVRAANGLMLVNREGHGAGRRARRAPAGSASTTCRTPSRPREITFWRSGGARRASLHLRRPLRLHLARDGRLRRQHRADPRPRRSRAGPRRSAAGGCRGSGRPAARRRRGRGASIAAIIPSVTATGSTSATGTAASSSSTSRIWPSRASSPGSTGARPSSRRPTPRCRCRFRSHGRRVMLVADEDVAKLEPGPPSFLWLVDITDEKQAGAVRQLPGRRRRRAGRSRTSPAAISRARRSPPPRFPVAWFAHGLRIVDIAQPARAARGRALPAAACRRARRACAATTCAWTIAG